MLEGPSDGQLIKPCVQSRPKSTLDHVAHGLSSWILSFQGWRIHSHSKKPTSVFNDTRSEKYFPDV